MKKNVKQIAELLSLYHHRDLKAMNMALSLLITQSITYNKCASAIIDSIELLEFVVTYISEEKPLQIKNVPTDYIYIDIHNNPYSYKFSEPRVGPLVSHILEDHDPDDVLTEEDLYFYKVYFRQDLSALYIILAMLNLRDALIFNNISTLGQTVIDELNLGHFFLMYYTANGFYTPKSSTDLVADCSTYLEESIDNSETKAYMILLYNEIISVYPEEDIANLISVKAKDCTRKIAGNIATFWSNADIYNSGSITSFERKFKIHLRNLIATACACVVMAEASEESIVLSSIWHKLASLGLKYIGKNMETEVKSIKGPVDDTPVNYHVDKNIEYKDVEGEGWD